MLGTQKVGPPRTWYRDNVKEEYERIVPSGESRRKKPRRLKYKFPLLMYIYWFKKFKAFSDVISALKAFGAK